MEAELLAPDPAGVDRAAALLRAGRVVAFPTDTVYGLAALARDQAAVERIFEIKGRPRDRALVLMVAREQLVEEWAQLSAQARTLGARFWPGPLTLVLPARSNVKPPLASAAGGIGVRIPAHPLAIALLESAAEPLATTSANLSGLPPALEATSAGLAGVAAVLDGGPAPGVAASTVLDLTGPEPRLLRIGPISAADLVGALGGVAIT